MKSEFTTLNNENQKKVIRRRQIADVLSIILPIILAVTSASGFANAQTQARPSPSPLSVPTGNPVPVPKLSAAIMTGENPQTDERNLSAKELGISLAGNVLTFETIEDYRRVVDNPTEEMSGKFRAAIKNYSKFQSYSNARRTAESAFNDEYFESMLNSDQVVQIGEHLFRVNPNIKKVFVLPASKISEYKDLVAENVSNKNISVYSTDEDVLDLVTGNASNQKPLICNESGVGSDARKEYFKIGRTTYETLGAFNKYGIFFSLFAEVKPSAGNNQFLFEFDNGYGYIHWHARCGLTADYGTISAGNDNFGYSKQRYQSYQGSKNLNNFFFGYTIILKSNGARMTGLNIRKNW